MNILSLTILLAIPTEVGGTNHTRAFAKAAATPEAHKACLNISKALSAVGVRVLTDAAFVEQVRGAFIVAKDSCHQSSFQH